MATVPEIVFRWKCALASCNEEQSGLYADEKQCETEFTKHLERHSGNDFVQFMLGHSKWRGKFTLMGSE
jgi:hypothetical protein